MVDIEIIEIEYNPNEDLGDYEFDPEYGIGDDDEDN